jgi:putative transcription factor
MNHVFIPGSNKEGMDCEMCGKNVPHLTKVRIDGAILNVCDACAKFGTPAESIRTSFSKPAAEEPIATIKINQKRIIVPPARPTSRRRTRDNIDSLTVVQDYGELIKEAREKLNMTQDELAAKILERKNVLSSMERGDLLPEIKVARKLEKVLGITLVEKEE